MYTASHRLIKLHEEFFFENFILTKQLDIPTQIMEQHWRIAVQTLQFSTQRLIQHIVAVYLSHDGRKIIQFSAICNRQRAVRIII